MKIIEKKFKNSKYKTLDKEIDSVLSLTKVFLSAESDSMDKDEVDFTKDCIKSLGNLKQRINHYGVE